MKRLWILAFAAACTGGTDGPPNTSPVRSITVALSAPQIDVGRTAQATATLLDAKGNAITNRVPLWSSLSPNVVSVSATGVVTGLQAGAATVRATSGTVSGDAQIVVANPVAASITLSRDTATVFIPNGSVQLIPTVKDSAGRVLTATAIFWQSTAPLIATVNSSGLVIGVAVGTTTIRASIDGQTTQATVTVKATPNANAPAIVSITPSLLRPGGTFVLAGTNFGATTGANAVVVDGVPVTVTAATATQLSITLPSTGFACEPTRGVFVQITTNGLIGGGPGTLQAANARSLAPGQSVIVTNANEVRCNELTQTGGRYVISVYDADRSSVTPGATASVSVTLRGAAPAGTGRAAAAAVRQAAPPARIRVPLIGSPSFDIANRLRREREIEQTHDRILERNIEYLRTHRAAIDAAARAIPPGPSRSSNSQVGTVGAITQLKIPNLDVTGYCTSNIPIGVRTVYVGQHAIIVEDTATTFAGQPTLQGQMNSYFTELGQEFDNVMWPILTGNFGNPLAMDGRLSGTGKVIMVFSPRVNGLQGGNVLGFVVSCDFQQLSQAPSSNVGEYFYAVVPTSTAAGYANPATRDSWLHVMRSTVIHEVKHVTAFAERLSAGLPLEEASWEEGMARTAEELYARTFYGVGAKQDVTYAASIACDIRYTSATSQCAGRPVLMLRHFDGLYSYLGTPELLSPLGRTYAADATFYASAWSVLRWANDEFATSESQFLKDFTTSPVTGVANLEARTGQTWEQSLGEWSLALYLDDASPFQPADPRIGFPSWNLPDIWAGMCSDLGPCTNPNNTTQLYPRASPYNPHLETFGNFTTTISSLAGGGVAIFDLSGANSGTQLLELRSFIGGDPPPTVRLAIIRVQ